MEEKKKAKDEEAAKIKLQKMQEMKEQKKLIKELHSNDEEEMARREEERNRAFLLGKQPL